MEIFVRELKPGDLFLSDPIGIPPTNPENIRYDVYFIIEVERVGPIPRAWYQIKALHMDHGGSPSIVDISARREEIFSRNCIPLRFQEMDLALSDPIPEYSE